MMDETGLVHGASEGLVSGLSEASGYIALSGWDLAVAASLVLIAGSISWRLHLGLAHRLAIASVRTVVQLILIGYVLKWIFGLDSAPALFAILAVMVTAAGRAAVQRSSRIFEGAFVRGVATLSITGLATTFTVTSIVIGVDPWYRPQYVLPLLGMVLGNGLTGISLCLDQLLQQFDERRDLIETHLALGATRWEAGRDAVAQAVRRGMIPIINSMMVVGIVSLPGMMTGQILAGADPLDAVKYQIIVMFMLAAGTALGCIIMALLTFKRMFNDRHQLLFEDIKRRS